MKVLIGRPTKFYGLGRLLATVHLEEPGTGKVWCRHHKVDWRKITHGWWPAEEVRRVGRLPYGDDQGKRICGRCWRSFRSVYGG